MAPTDHRAYIEYLKCAGDFTYFVDTYGLIDNPQGADTGIIPFRLWPSQITPAQCMARERLLLFLKARQLGFSWLACLYALWLCLYHPGRAVFFFSRGQDEADEMMRRLQAVYDRLPEWMRAICPAVTKRNTEEMAWSNGSRARSMPASPNSGRSFTASLVVMDEAAFMTWAEMLYTAIKPIIDGGGQLFVISTANGMGNLFHRLWTGAAAGTNGFTPIFLPWSAHPGRDQAWYERQKAEYTDPRMVLQEYPATPQEAFVASGRVRFAPEWIHAHAYALRPGIPVHEWPTPLLGSDGLTIYHRPRPGQRVILGADVAEGLEHGDASTATLIDADTWEEVATLHGRWEPDEFARQIDRVARAYRAVVAVERNNHGHAVLAMLKMLRTPQVWTFEDDRAGWVTNAKTKPQLIDLLAQALRDNLCIIHTEAALNEMAHYRILANGTTGAPSGEHDDRVMAWAIALFVARKPAKPTGILVQNVVKGW